MKKIDKRFLTLLLLLLAAVFFYFGSRAIMDSGMNGRMFANDWMGINSSAWVPALFSFGLCIIVSWLLFRKKY